METISLKVFELYDLKAMILGWQVPDETGKPRIILPGFVNEKTLPEGVKRAAYQISKTINEQIELVDTQRKGFRAISDDTLTPEELAKLKESKDRELLNDEVKIVIDKIDFSRIEHLSLGDNYLTLYDKIFK